MLLLSLLLLLLLLLWFLLLLLLVVLLLQLLLSLHVMLVVFVLLFFVIYNADSASTDIASASSLCISGRSPNQHHSKNKDIVCAFGGTGEVDAR